MADLSVWTLKADCDRDVVLRTNLDFFRDRFVGRPLCAEWTAPPIEILGKRKRLRDFVSWMLCAPVVSQKARDALGPVLADCVEFLPLIVLKRSQYWAINVLTLAGCLDPNRSRVLYSPDDPTRIIDLSEIRFVDAEIPDVPIFKVTQHPSPVFVRQPFVDAVIANGLRGAAFADPVANPFDAILRGQSQNVIPGVLE